MNENIEFPCKCCHPLERHQEIEESYGEWKWHEDLQENVWVEAPYPRFVCFSCNTDCNFEPMNNLEFLEWKHDNNRNT